MEIKERRIMAGEDKFANYAIISVVESAANTLTFKKLETGISLNEKVAWIINRVEYLSNQINATIFNATGDSLDFGMSLSNAFTTPNLAENTIIDCNKFTRIDIGASASGEMQLQPWVKDFSALPGGGIIVPPTPLYLYAMGTGLTGVAAMTARIHYTLKTLKIDEYWELVEARRVLSS